MQMRRTAHIGMSDDVKKARMGCIGGSDARILMSGDQEAIERLWLEKRGEVPPEDFSDVLLVQMGNITEDLNLDWFEKETGFVVTDEQTRPAYADWPVAMSTLDGIVRETPDGPALGILEAKFMFPFGFKIEDAVEKYTSQCQHNMMVTGLPRAWLSVITGAGGYYVKEIEADFFYQVALLEAERDFWDCVQTGRVPGVPDVNVPMAERVRVVDMSESNEWGEKASILVETKAAHEKFEKAKKSIKLMLPPDAKVASGKGVTISLSKDGKKLINIDKDAIAEAERRLAA
jgi:predicted phage-related endonuclease